MPKHQIVTALLLGLTEKGNTLLVTEDGDSFVAWLDIGSPGRAFHRLEVSWNPDDYPSLSVSVVEMTDKKLAKHINENCEGWIIRKCNVEGVKREAPEPVPPGAMPAMIGGCDRVALA